MIREGRKAPKQSGDTIESRVQQENGPGEQLICPQIIRRRLDDEKHIVHHRGWVGLSSAIAESN
jgi:hypothetical protein